MAYSTPAMVRLALHPSLDDGSNPPTDPSNTAADLTNDQLTDMIAEADSTIDSMVGAYYMVPVATDPSTGSTPHPIDYWSRNLAAYAATLAFREGLDLQDTDPVVRRYTATMAALTAVQSGTARLQIPVNMGPNSGVWAGNVNNGYVGDLFSPADWNLRPINNGWPFWPDVPNGVGSW